MLTVLAPAKLNLTLEVLGERQDGFHEIRSVVQTVNLYDSLHFQLGQNLEFKSDVPDWTPEKSLVSKSAGLIQETTGCTKGATIEVNKRIPWLSGLGGDSSDAAAILRGLNKLWGLGLSLKELFELASQLSSDVAFFLYGGTALVRGRGELVTPLPPFPHMWVVLMMPPVSRRLGKTKQLYSRLKRSHYTDGQVTEKLLRMLNEGEEFEPSLLFNTFENVAFEHFSKLRVYREHIIKLGASNIHLAGSGPTLFAMFKDRAQAEDLYTRCKDQGMEVYVVKTLAGMETIE